MLNNFLKKLDLKEQIELSKDLYTDIIKQLGGSQIDSGLFTIFKREDIDKWNLIIKDTFNDFIFDAKLFGYDWLGRCFGIDLRRKKFGNVLMYDVGTADILEIPCNLEVFLEEEIIFNSDMCLLKTDFEEWRGYSQQVVKYGQCVGYVVPLFLSGENIKENLELSDMEVYWGIMGQVMNQIL